ncbi:hypothetical protein QBC33DRAFT_584336 [Phialemonium atrogriseum]|uniref:Carrier domain-containing protein n=1 Tax=Phialemonium atrogriseum TaxID=1093897 RepID=A0AAJ0FU84_9PEZI|nr:uncharacterized protein QBC33DRAFT_584336 [Phialemonium atrogriseum]KAK1772875.1 hypothetical protein QBC33DRAFT_584336 [Phialemonium atrogriseum]
MNGHSSPFINATADGTNGVHATPPPSEPKTMPLAIVGMACRFSAGVISPDKLWELVSQGRDAWSEVPSDRFNQKAFYHPEAERLSTLHMKGGFFLQEDPGAFDCLFFNLSADVAAAMDPQIRLQLEVVFEALESAGIPLSKAVGSNTSVYTGSFTKDYHDLQLRDPLHASRGFVTGNYAAMLANRSSHFFDLKGPSTAVDTGCSTSLMGLHLACQSLRFGDSDCAIVGGTCLNLNPDAFANLSTLQTCGAEGKCYAFDHRAQSYGRGDGIAAIIVKRLSDALRDGDAIRAWYRRLISQCYKTAGLDPFDTSVVEAHGTGTRVGDPAEANAIGEALGRHRPVGSPPLYVASVKTNLGHTEAASGLAAVIKMVMSLEHEHIPPSLNFEKANPEIDMEALRIKVPTSLKQWLSRGVRRVSVNNFGYGGTNTHVIMEEAGHLASLNQTSGGSSSAERPSRHLFLLSARDKAAVSKMAANLREHIERQPDTYADASFADLAYTLCERRSKFPWTWSTSAADATELVAALADTSIPPVSNMGTAPRLGFVFNGQGAQWFAMGRELAAAYSVYAQTLDECDRIIHSFGANWSLVDEVSRDKETSRVDEVEFSMPLSCAVQLALVQLLRFFGVEPTAVTGHSSGEVAAAFAAGAISLDEAMACTYFRGSINARHLEVGPCGSMMAIGLGLVEAQTYLDDFTRSDDSDSGKVVVACVNSPSSVTLSGDLSAIRELEARFTADSIFARRLRVQAAFHSHHMLPLEEEYRRVLVQHMNRGKDRAFAHGVIFVSPVTGKRIDDANQLGPEHWMRNMTHPVLFAQSFQNMLAPSGRFSKVHRALKSLPVVYASSLERGTDAVRTIQTLASLLVKRGYPANTSHINAPHGEKGLRAIAGLPSYPWNHTQRFWHESRTSADHRFRPYPSHDLLGTRVTGTSDRSPIWRHIIRGGELPWVHEHVVQGDTVYPAAGFIAMAIEAMRQLHDADADRVSGYLLSEVEILKALVLPESEKGVEVQLFLEPANEKTLAYGKRLFRIYSAQSEVEGSWARGLIAVEKTTGSALDSSRLRSTSSIKFDAAYPRSMNPKTLYDALQAVGVRHGPSFRKLLHVRRGEDESTSTFEICDSAALMPYKYQQTHVIHPITLDAVFQAAYTTLSPEARKMVGTAVPTSIKSLYISSAISSKPGDRFDAYARLLNQHRQGFEVALAVLEEGLDASARPSKPLIEVDTMRFTSVGSSIYDSDTGLTAAASHICAFIDWEPSLSLNNPVTQWESRLQRPADPAEKTVAQDLIRAAYYLIADAAAQLTPSDTANLSWHHKSLLRWMRLQLQLAASDTLAPRSSRWARATPGAKAMFLDRVSGASTNGELVVRVGRNLPAILRREVAPLEVMLEGGLLYRFYGDMLHFTHSTAQLAQLAGAAARDNPRMRILEIGGGTGGCTGPVLDVLGALSGGRVNAVGFEHYDFTDISSGFFQAARERFAEWGDLISYAALNIEKDVVEQGFEEKSYDLIIAAQVLHATKSMAVTMRNVRRLLKDGGKLLLVETTRDTIDGHLIFGTLPGWWLSEEPERKLSPNMSLETWEPILKGAAGFTGLDLNVWDCQDEQHQMMSVIMSTAIPETRPVYEDQVALVYDKTTPPPPPPSEWLQGLAASIKKITGVTPPLAELTELDVKGKICIFLSGLDGAPQKIDGSNFEAIKSLTTSCKGLLWVTSGSAIDCPVPENALHTGFLRTCRAEDGSRRLVSLDLDPAREPWDPVSQAVIAKILATAFDDSESTNNSTPPGEFEFAERGGTILVSRLRRDATESASYANTPGEPEMQPFVQSGLDGRQLKLEVTKPGLLDSIVFRDDEDAGQPLPDDCVEVQPRAYGINFRDVMGAMGQLDERQELGVESAGVITRATAGAAARGLYVGARVVALTPHGHIAARVRAPWTSVAPMPDDMEFCEGLAIGAVFVTAYYSMFEAARLELGETVLIHAASEGRRAGVHHPHAVEGARGVCHRRNAREARVPDADRGVDVVINSLAGALLHESWGVLATHGRFIEIGKKDIHRNMSLDMATFRKAASFIAVDVVQLCDYRGRVVHRVLAAVMELLRNKTIRNIAPIVTYPMAEIGRALRTMQAGKHMGKIVVVPGVGDMVKTLPRRDAARLSPDASYLIVGGLGGIGRSIARWSVDRGAKNLILLSRSAATGPHSQALGEELTAMGANVVTKNCNAADMASLRFILDECAKTMPPVRGVIHGGMVLNDSILELMTPSQWQEALGPKVTATQNLEALFPGPSSLDFFTILSSAIGVIGSASQSNYSAGGSFQDAVARRRASRGLPCVTINLGMVDGVGFVAESDATVAERLLGSGHRPLSETDMHQLIDYAVRTPVRSVRTAQVVAGLAGSAIRRQGPGWTRERRFAPLRDDDASGGRNAAGLARGGGSGSVGLKEHLAGAQSADEAGGLVERAVVGKLADMFVIPEQDIDATQPLAKYGVDSLVAVELRNWLVPMTQCEMSIFDLLGASSLRELAKNIVGRSRLVYLSK